MVVFSALVLWLHLAAVVVWVGGLFCWFLVLGPGPNVTMESTGVSPRFMEAVAVRFRAISWEAVGLIVLTGLFNLIQAGAARGFNFSGAYLSVLLVKLALVAAMVGLQAWQSFGLTPRLTALTSGPAPGSAPGPDTLLGLRKRMLAASTLFLILAALVLLLGVTLRYV